jgi:hypothetical protein
MKGLALFYPRVEESSDGNVRVVFVLTQPGTEAPCEVSTPWMAPENARELAKTLLAVAADED